MSLFDNAKEKKFIVAPAELIPDHEVLIILTDIEFWNIFYEDLQVWCNNNNSQREGMTVVLPNKEALTAFCLKWG